MILVCKPYVFRFQGRWRVDVLHAHGFYTQNWPHRVPAMNCALAIARTSTCQPILKPEDPPTQIFGLREHP